MPFEDLKEVEFNFIWVGGEMPTSQLENLMVFSRDNGNPKINVWVDTKDTYNALVKQMQVQLKTINSARKQVNQLPLKFKERFSKISFQLINNDALGIPLEVATIIDKCREAKLWACMSDIYRLFILSRKPDPKATEHARVYVEADNIMLKNLWEKFHKRDVAAVYSDNFDPDHKIFPPEQFRTDLLLLDITSPNGQKFAASIRPNFIKLFTDPILKIYFNTLLEHAKKQGGLAENDVLGSSGTLVTALFRLHFMKIDEPLLGFKEILLATSSLNNTLMALPNMDTGNINFRSWLDPKNKYTLAEDGYLFPLLVLRIAEITDPSGNMLKNYCMIFGADQSKYFDSFESAILRHQQLPEWLIKAKDCHNQEINSKSSAKVKNSPG